MSFKVVCAVIVDINLFLFFWFLPGNQTVGELKASLLLARQLDLHIECWRLLWSTLHCLPDHITNFCQRSNSSSVSVLLADTRDYSMAAGTRQKKTKRWSYSERSLRRMALY